jgi:lysine 6-dehydrogenase
MKKVIVLGAGMVGRAMALDMAKAHEVTVLDYDAQALENIKNKNDTINAICNDVTQKQELKNTLQDFDLVICAVPGFLGFETLKTIIEAKKDVVDISFFAENALELKALAKAQQVTAIVDCGVAPGMSNLILGQYNTLLKIDSFECLVGGLPKEKTWPFCYKAPFSPVDVIEEYTRPARYVENGALVTKPALSDCEYVDFEDIGTLEAFNSDGLRSLIFTMPHIPNMIEKTLRYPGHVEYIKVLRASGFFDTQAIKVNDTHVTPLDFTSSILFKAWELSEHDKELTLMRITIVGKNANGEKVNITYNLHDTYCEKTGISSMSRTTGYTATAAAQLILDKTFNKKGVFPPELIGGYDSCFERILDYLKERGVNYHKTECIIS